MVEMNSEPKHCGKLNGEQLVTRKDYDELKKDFELLKSALSIYANKDFYDLIKNGLYRKKGEAFFYLERGNEFLSMDLGEIARNVLMELKNEKTS